MRSAFHKKHAKPRRVARAWDGLVMKIRSLMMSQQPAAQIGFAQPAAQIGFAVFESHKFSRTIGIESKPVPTCKWRFGWLKSMSARFPGRSTLAEDSISVAELFRPGFNGFPAYFADVFSAGMRIE